MMWLSKLNGWQRIWLVLSIFYLLIVITGSVYLINEGKPSTAKIKENYVSKLLELVSEHDSDYKELSYEAKQIVFDKLLKDDNLLNNFKNKFKDNNKFLELEEKYNND